MVFHLSQTYATLLQTYTINVNAIFIFHTKSLISTTLKRGSIRIYGWMTWLEAGIN